MRIKPRIRLVSLTAVLGCTLAMIPGRSYLDTLDSMQHNHHVMEPKTSNNPFHDPNSLHHHHTRTNRNHFRDDRSPEFHHNVETDANRDAFLDGLRIDNTGAHSHDSFSSPDFNTRRDPFLDGLMIEGTTFSHESFASPQRAIYSPPPVEQQQQTMNPFVDGPRMDAATDYRTNSFSNFGFESVSRPDPPFPMNSRVNGFDREPPPPLEANRNHHFDIPRMETSQYHANAFPNNGFQTISNPDPPPPVGARDNIFVNVPPPPEEATRNDFFNGNRRDASDYGQTTFSNPGTFSNYAHSNPTFPDPNPPPFSNHIFPDPNPPPFSNVALPNVASSPPPSNFAHASFPSGETVAVTTMRAPLLMGAMELLDSALQSDPFAAFELIKMIEQLRYRSPADMRSFVAQLLEQVDRPLPWWTKYRLMATTSRRARRACLCRVLNLFSASQLHRGGSYAERRRLLFVEVLQSLSNLYYRSEDVTKQKGREYFKDDLYYRGEDDFKNDEYYKKDVNFKNDDFTKKKPDVPAVITLEQAAEARAYSTRYLRDSEQLFGPTQRI